MVIKVGGKNRNKKAKDAAAGRSQSYSQHFDGNPINARATDADWDEDIDEDFAFNSDDEKMFGHHFSGGKKSASSEGKAETKKMRKTTADAKKGSKKKAAAVESDDDDAGEVDGDRADMSDIFDRLNPVTANKAAAANASMADIVGKGNKKSDKKDDDVIGSDMFSDDSRSEIDLEEMLMTKEERRKAQEKRKKKNKRPADGAEAGATNTSKKFGGRAGATETDDFLLRQQEGLLIGSDLHENLGRLSAATAVIESGKKVKGKKSAAKKESDELFELSTAVVNPEAEKRSLAKNEMQSIKALVEQSEGLDKGQTASRLLSAVNNRKSLLTEDLDDYEKLKQDRSVTRELVGKSLNRYEGTLKEQRLAKHLRFPLEVPDADAVPNSLGGMAAAIMAKQGKTSTTTDAPLAASDAAVVPPPAAANKVAAPAPPANSLAAKMQALLESSGLATKKSTPATHDGSGAFQEGQDGYVDIKERPEGAEDNEGDENEFAMGGGGSGGDGKGVDRGYMAMLKAKLGYEIARRTRFNKIKSKTYRRILRKEEEREKARREQANEILDPEGARRRRTEKMEKDRALERVTQKHKNTSKWVRHVKGFAKFDDDAKEAIQQQLMTHNRLMQKMDEEAGAEWDEYEAAERASQAESEEEDRVVDALLNGEEDAADAKVKTSLFWGGNANNNNNKDKGGGAANERTSFIDKARKELGEMGFMKKAREREEKELKDEVEKLKADVERYKRGDALHHVNDYGEDVSEDTAAAKAASAHPGRQRFTAPSATIHTNQTAEDEALAGLFPVEDDDDANDNDDDIKENRDDEENNSDVENAEAKRIAKKKINLTKKGKNASDEKKKIVVAPLKSSGIAAGPVVSEPARHNLGNASSSSSAAAASSEGEGTNFVGLRVKGSKGGALGSATQIHGDNNNSNSKKIVKRTRGEAAIEDEFDGRDDGNGAENEDNGDTFVGPTAPSSLSEKKSKSTRITLHPSKDEIIPISSLIKAKNAEAKASTTRSASAASSSSASSAGATATSTAASSDAEKKDAAALNSEDAHQLQQEYLASRAFAKDDIDEDFLKMKEQQVEAIMKPKDKNASLPGWGEWGGENEQLGKRHKQKVATMELQRSLQKTALMKARADAKLDHVIISHEVDLVPDKYSLHMIPRPFSNAKEYLHSMRQPVGPEWNSPMTFKETTQPRITTVQGAIIDPLDISTKKEKAKTKRRKVEKKKQL